MTKTTFVVGGGNAFVGPSAPWPGTVSRKTTFDPLFTFFERTPSPPPGGRRCWPLLQGMSASEVPPAPRTPPRPVSGIRADADRGSGAARVSGSRNVFGVHAGRNIIALSIHAGLGNSRDSPISLSDVTGLGLENLDNYGVDVAKSSALNEAAAAATTGAAAAAAARINPAAANVGLPPAPPSQNAPTKRRNADWQKPSLIKLFAQRAAQSIVADGTLDFGKVLPPVLRHDQPEAFPEGKAVSVSAVQRFETAFKGLAALCQESLTATENSTKEALVNSNNHCATGLQVQAQARMFLVSFALQKVNASGYAPPLKTSADGTTKCDGIKFPAPALDTETFQKLLEINAHFAHQASAAAHRKVADAQASAAKQAFGAKVLEHGGREPQRGLVGDAIREAVTAAANASTSGPAAARAAAAAATAAAAAAAAGAAPAAAPAAPAVGSAAEPVVRATGSAAKRQRATDEERARELLANGGGSGLQVAREKFAKMMADSTQAAAARFETKLEVTQAELKARLDALHVQTQAAVSLMTNLEQNVTTQGALLLQMLEERKKSGGSSAAV